MNKIASTEKTNFKLDIIYCIVLMMELLVMLKWVFISLQQ